MFCQNCGAEIHDNAVVCVKCGCAVNGAGNSENKEWLIVLLLCFFLGFCKLFIIFPFIFFVS